MKPCEKGLLTSSFHASPALFVLYISKHRNFLMGGSGEDNRNQRS
jgi:hypothetical protein